MDEGFYIGIEAGQRTVALLANAEGEVVGRGTAGPSIYTSVGQEQCEQSLWKAIIGAFNGAGINSRDLLASDTPLPEVTAICLGMPGIERPKDESAIKRILADFNLTRQMLITNDAHIALLSGVSEGYGVAVISGENSLAFGVGRNGLKARAGGWGYLLGDEGSSYWIGLEAVKAVLAQADGRGDETALTEMIGLEWKIPPNRPDSFSRHVYTLAASLGTGGNKAQLENTVDNYRREVGKLAPLVERAALKGDIVSSEILDRAAGHLAQAATAVIERTELTAIDPMRRAAMSLLSNANNNPLVPLAFGGPLLLSNQGELRSRLYEQLKELCAAPVLVTEPAEGALRLAMELK